MMKKFFKNPSPWGVLALVVVSVVTLSISGGMAESAAATLTTLLAAVIFYFAAVRAAMWMTFLSQNKLMERIHDDPKLVTQIICTIMFSLAVVFHGVFG